jgi:hypothetical protein
MNYFEKEQNIMSDYDFTVKYIQDIKYHPQTDIDNLVTMMLLYYDSYMEDIGNMSEFNFDDMIDYYEHDFVTGEIYSNLKEIDFYA